ncbi:MAG: hypothetical protein WCK51_13280 [Armatimonadota bacterium]
MNRYVDGFLWSCLVRRDSNKQVSTPKAKKRQYELNRVGIAMPYA